MTTPKIKLTNSGADPALDGEITMNDTTIKGKSDGSVINFGRSIQTQLGQLSELIGSGSGSFTAFGGNLNTTWTTKVSRTITPDSVPNKVVIAGYASGHSTGTGTSIYLRVREGGVNVTSEVSDAPSFSDNPVGVSANAILDDVSDSSKTYDAQVKQDFNHVRLAYCSLYVAVIKLA